MAEYEDVLREIYTSDVILMDKELEMMNNVDDSYFDKLEELHTRVENDYIALSSEELNSLEQSFNEFYFEYGFVQFKRGLELGLSMRNIS